jgi:hypothetical protein
MTALGCSATRKKNLLVILLVSPCMIKGLAKGRSMLPGKLLACAIFKDAELNSHAIYWIFYEGNTLLLCYSLSTVLYISPISSVYESVYLSVKHFLTVFFTQSLHNNNKAPNVLINNKSDTFYIIYKIEGIPNRY